MLISTFFGLSPLSRSCTVHVGACTPRRLRPICHPSFPLDCHREQHVTSSSRLESLSWLGQELPSRNLGVVGGINARIPTLFPFLLLGSCRTSHPPFLI
ncbi:hypothetical protein B0T26DRAFT_115967 [Lasiosphaeria miniovina]|uniref:Uncharacterized protein n=1 Tax=Lasiosphaeria miniovina TaxID=1954250 RepID=A0AA40B3P3_9PEZI|nr:uncharacterized protein B0T26DRAFT_115967 [Lasiosphaeria miniovina]KAK0727077.1 hypothetical protein B0T26DRAFT_115967 [Lasiosphaeria miniovina]